MKTFFNLAVPTITTTSTNPEISQFFKTETTKVENPTLVTSTNTKISRFFAPQKKAQASIKPNQGGRDVRPPKPRASREAKIDDFLSKNGPGKNMLNEEAILTDSSGSGTESDLDDEKPASETNQEQPAISGVCFCLCLSLLTYDLSLVS